MAGSQNLPQAYNTEYEISQPRLLVKQWSLSLSAVDSVSGFDASYHFSGSEGMMWNDLGPVKAVPLAQHSLSTLDKKSLSTQLQDTLKPQQLKKLKALKKH